MADMAALWEQLEAWSKEHAPAMLTELNPGATEEQLEKLEQALGRELPADYRESLRVHNGEADGWPFRVFADMGSYHSCDVVLEDRKAYQEVADDVDYGFDEPDDDVITVEGPVKAVLFDDAWVPIMNSNGDVFWALDFAPKAGGVEGQVIEVDYEGCSWKVVANSFGELMEKYVKALQAGEYEIDSEGLATKEPDDYDEELEAEIDAEHANAPSIDDLDALDAGTETTIVGMRVGDPSDEKSLIWLRHGPVELNARLGDASWEKVLRIRIKVGKRGAGPHDLIDWEALG